MANETAPHPLDGITVVSLEQAIAAPFCTRHLADLGARVIKIERPGVGDFARGYDQRVRGLSSHFVWTNRSKESLTLNLKHAEAAPILDKLLGQADVLVQKSRPRSSHPAGPGLFRPMRAFSPANCVQHFRLWGERALRAEKGLRLARPKRGWIVVGHGWAGRRSHRLAH